MQNIELVDPDDKTCAELSRRFDDYNAAHSTWDWRSFSCVIRIAGQVVAGGRGIVNMQKNFTSKWATKLFPGSNSRTDGRIDMKKELNIQTKTKKLQISFLSRI